MAPDQPRAAAAASTSSAASSASASVRQPSCTRRSTSRPWWTARALAVAALALLSGGASAARPGRADTAAISSALAATRHLLAAADRAASSANATSSPAAAAAAAAQLKDRLAKANAVLALRKAGLLPGNARLPASLQAKTVDAVNQAAPAYDLPGGGSMRPVLSQQVGGDAAGAPAAAPSSSAWGPPKDWLATAPRVAPPRGFDGGPAAPTEPVRAPAGVNATGPLADLMEAAKASQAGAPDPAAASPAASPAHDKALDGRVRSNALIGELGGLGADQSTGSVIQMLAGFRVATPWFGTGFNFCVDRYFGSFPKVGIVIPNAAAWLLPDLAGLFGEDPMHATVNLPGPGKGLPKGARAEPTSDGFVLWMPTTQPLYISNFGFRYSLQVAQLFGVDFGFGILKIGCRVDFVRV